MLVVWDEALTKDKNRIFNYGSCKLVVRFNKISGSKIWYSGSTSLDAIPYTARYKPILLSQHPDTVLICNANIYNVPELLVKYNVTLETTRKEEVIIHIYKAVGIVETLQELHGEYAFVLVDSNRSYIVRDVMGTRGVSYIQYPSEAGPAAVAFRSSLLTVHDLNKDGQIRHVKPGTLMYHDSNHVWRRKVFGDVYQTPKFARNISTPLSDPPSSGFSQMRLKLRSILRHVVTQRCRSVGNIGLLLSGGLNCMIIGNVLREEQIRGLRTFFLGKKCAHERQSASRGAEVLNAQHHDVIFDEQQAVKDIPKVIALMETYDTSTIRKGLLLYTICKYITERSPVDVLFCGEGLDDVAGSHIYFKQTKNAEEYQRAVEFNLTRYRARDGLDKIASWFGINIVFPFLDPLFASYYLSFSEEDRMPRFGIEKYFLRASLDHSDIISEDFLWRHREDWVDSVSCYDKFWLDKFSKTISSTKVDGERYKEKEKLYSHNTPLTEEEFYYREIFEKTFPDQFSMVPVISRPLLGVGTDPSPRRWPIYTQHLCVDFLKTVRAMI